jgi:CRISPR-associated protein Csd2
MGNAPAHVLFDTVKVGRVDQVSDAPSRNFSDYKVTVPANNELPDGVSVKVIL